VLSKVFIAVEIEGAGDKGSEYSAMIDVESLMEAFLKMPLKCFCERIFVKFSFLVFFDSLSKKLKIH